jgi:hypothetical protein
MEGTVIVGWLLVLIGAIVALAGFIKIKGVKKIHPLLALGGGGILIVAGLIGAGVMTWETESAGTASITPSGTTSTGCATWDITPSVSSSEATLNGDETIFTVSARANTTAHTITESDNTTWVNPVLQFVCKPNPLMTANADSLGTLHYEVVNPEVTTSDGTDTYKLFTTSSGNRQLIWAGDGTEYVSGSSTMLMTENVTLTLTMTCSQDSYSRMENTYDSTSVYIRFYNDCGWSETFTVNFMLQETWS